MRCASRTRPNAHSVAPCADGPTYWLFRDYLPEGDRRNYSDPIFRSLPPPLTLLFPPPVGTVLPLTPLTPEELLAALVLPEEACRAALLRCLEYFGSTRLEPRAGEESSSELWEVRFGVAAGARRAELPMASMSVAVLEEAAVACIVQAVLDPTDASGEASRAFTDRITSMSPELGLIRRWRARTPRAASPRHKAVVTATYLAWKNPRGHVVAEGDELSRAECEDICVTLQADSADEAVIRACLNRLERAVPADHLQQLVATLESWFAIGAGTTIVSTRPPMLAAVAPATVPHQLDSVWGKVRHLVEAGLLTYDEGGRGTFYGASTVLGIADCEHSECDDTITTHPRPTQ